jgi:hypothetical protein
MQDPLYVGDTLDFVTAVEDYPASDGYVLTYRLVPRIAGTPITIVASASGDDYRVLVFPATTATWAAGEYTWNSWVWNGIQRYTIQAGTVTIKPDLTTATVYDGRSRAEVALSDAQAALDNFNATGGLVKRYSIAGRDMEFHSITDVLKLVNYWQIAVNREYAAAALAAGQSDPRRIFIRMGNV